MAPELRITRGFLDALARLSVEDQKRTREALSRTLADSSRGGLRLHQVGEYLSVSPTMGIRLLARQGGSRITFVYADHHAPAYAWAERHKALMDDGGDVFALVDVAVSEPSDDAVSEPSGVRSDPRFAGLPSIVGEWLSSLRDEDSLLDAIGSLAPELQEMALASAATAPGVLSDPPSNVVVIGDDATLEEALRLPSAAWRVFLHPRQRHVVTLPNDRHVLVRGGPGTGKTVVLAHRFVRLYREAIRTRAAPPAFVALTPASRLVARKMLSQLGVQIDEGSILVAQDLGRGQSALGRVLRQYGAVLVDEGQDLPTAAIASLLGLLEAGVPIPPVMIAFDANQAVVCPTGDALSRLAGIADTMTLTYCYRSTRQVVGEARALLARLHNDYRGKDFKASHLVSASRDLVSADYTAVLSGPDVSHLTVTMADAPAEVARVLNRLLRGRANDELAVIVVGPETQADLSLQPFHDAAGGVPVLRPVEAKGREFMAGVVVDLTGRGDCGGTEPAAITPARYRTLSGLYVGLTRFRDEATIVTVGSNEPRESYG